MRERIIIAGFGGQGILFLGKVLAQAMMEQGRNVTFFPSYGAEVRGGKAKCNVIISEDEIYSPIVLEADTLFAMNQPSWDFYAERLRPEGLAVINSSIVREGEADQGQRLVPVPATEIANELGETRVANMVMLGAYNALRKLLPAATLLDCLRSVLGERKAGLFDLNRRAIERGAAAAGGP